LSDLHFVREELVEPDLSGVALGKGIGGDQGCLAALGLELRWTTLGSNRGGPDVAPREPPSDRPRRPVAGTFDQLTRTAEGYPNSQIGVAFGRTPPQAIRPYYDPP
jgi:hypothetical protein